MRLIAFDTETTGTNPDKDRIVEITLAEPDRPARTWRINPEMRIPPGATEIHGIRDEDVANEPTFATLAPILESMLEGATLIGYNSRSFDTLILDAELRRAGRKGLPLDTLREIDVMRIWQALEPRSLTGASRRWLRRDHKDAHSSAADVRTTLDVLQAMMNHAGLDHEACVRHSRPANEIDRAGKLVIDETGHVVLTFGKWQGKPAKSVDPSYFQWMLNGEFPPSTKAVVLRLIAHGFDLPEAAAVRASLQVAPQAAR